jgi:hypothetical protein
MARTTAKWRKRFISIKTHYTQRTRPSPPAVVARKSEEEHLRSNKFLRRTRDVSPIMEVYDIVASLLFTHLKGVKWCVFFFAATGLVLTVKWFWH